VSSHRGRCSYGIERWARTVLAALVVTMFVAPLAARAQCAVTNLADSGNGSLRACITAANTAANGETISFSPSLNGGTVTVGWPLPITGNMTISGPGANLFSISGGNAVQIFDISSGTVAISGLTIGNGNSGGGGAGGGGIFNNATLTVSNCTLSADNGSQGGGIYNTGTLTVNNSTFSGDNSTQGSGIYNAGTLTVNNSTFSGDNSSQGAGIYNAGTLTINNGTLSGNTAGVEGGGIYNTGTLTLNNSIVAGNTTIMDQGDDCFACGPQGSNNLISTPSNVVSPMLAPLGWYGGPTQTLLPLPPGIGGGAASPTDNPSTDQRGFARPTSGAVSLGAVQTNYLIVTTLIDVSDGFPSCSSTDFMPCSLRDALALANSAGSADIAFLQQGNPGIDPVQGPAGIITLNSALPAVTGNLNLVGPGANMLTISGGGSQSVGTIFTVNSPNAAFSGITISGANSISSNGGITTTGTLAVSNSMFSGNSGTCGGAIGSGGTLTVYDSTFSVNTAGIGGGICGGGTMIVNNSMFTYNAADLGYGGGISFGDGTLTVNNSTFSGNYAYQGGGIDNGGTLTINNSILTADNEDECFGTGCPTNGSNGNVVDATPAQPILSPLGWYGGPTPVLLPLPGSPAICAGSVSLDPASLSTDLRGFARTNVVSGCLDAGAVQTNYLIVTTTTDVSDIPPACDASGDSPCSLRDALTLAARNGSADIGFAASVTGTIDLSTVNTPLPTITGNLDLIGPGASNLTVSGGGSSNVGSIFTVNSPNAAFSGISIANGNAGNSNGGAINNNSGSLTVTNSTISGNVAAQGGGIFNLATLAVSNSTFSGNTASSDGGGIFNDSGATLTVNDSTVSGNTAGGGIINNSATLTLHNSIVAGNTGDDCSGCYTQDSPNLIGGAPMLAPLGWYGGPAQTMLPLPESPAICAGSASFLPAGLSTDQRGFPRSTYYTGSYIFCLDLGAVQTNYQSIQFANSSYSGTSNSAINTPTAPVVTVTENGQNIGAVPVTLSFMGTQPGSSSGLGPLATIAGTGATFPALTVSPGGAYTLEASLNITPSVSISGTARLDLAAIVTSLTSTASGTYTTGAVISISVNFSNPVTVIGSPLLALNSGGTASYASGSGTSALVFTYTVASPQSTLGLGLDASSTTALTLNGGSIEGVGYIGANLTLPTPGAAGSLGANTTIVINAIQYQLITNVLPAGAGTVAANPTSTLNVTPTLPTGTYLSGSIVQITATPANAGYSFSNWTGSAPTSPTNPLPITMNGPVTETAHFGVNDVSVTINTSPQGLLVSVDHGTPATAPVAVKWQITSEHMIATSTPQTYNKTLYNFTDWSDLGAISHQVTATAGTTSYTASFAVPPTIAKSFSPTSIVVGGISTLSFTIKNPNASKSISAISFTDTFPAGIQVYGLPDASNACRGTFTPLAGGTVVRLSGASLAAGGSCSLSVKVKGTTATVLNNITGPIRSAPGGEGTTSNIATLTITTPIRLVQHTSVDAGTTSSSSLAFSSANTGGNWIGVVVRAGAPNEVFTVKDSAGNMYRKAVQQSVPGAPVGESLAILYAESIAGGRNTVTVSDTGLATLRFAILEYSGVAESNSIDRTASAEGASASPDSGVLTTTTNGDLLLAGILSADSETFTAGTGYTVEAEVPAEPNTKLLVEQRIQLAAGPAAAGATLSSRDQWGAVLAAFHPAPATVTK
jgi:hypothetical protein